MNEVLIETENTQSYGLVHLAQIPVRKEPDDRSEMTNQLLFGEAVRITDQKGNFFKILGHFDQYPGWVDKKQVQIVSHQSFIKATQGIQSTLNDSIMYIKQKEKNPMLITLGASLPLLDIDKNQLNWGNETHWFLDKKILYNTGKQSKEKLIKTAFIYINTPYLWGGRSLLGIDCSGFVQQVYKINGYRLLRDAKQQATQGETLNFLEETQAGDLAFFDNDDGYIIHVGIILENRRIIHAHGQVRIDTIDQTGIFNAEKGIYSHRLRLFKRFFN